MDIQFTEVAYNAHITALNGKQLFVECYYSGMTWKVYLENNGILACDFNLEDAVKSANEKLTHDGRFPFETINLDSLQKVSEESINAYNQELAAIAGHLGEDY